jgi:hypothetical protein
LLSALSDYAAGLQQLADKDFRKDMAKSSTDLAGALSDMNNTYEKNTGSGPDLNQSDIYVLAKMVDVVGSAYVECRRRRAIKAIVAKTGPATRQVSQLLHGEFSDIGPVVQRELETIETDFEKAYNAEATNMLFQGRIETRERIQIAHDNAKKQAHYMKVLAKPPGKSARPTPRSKKRLNETDGRRKNFLMKSRTWRIGQNQ